MSTPARSTVLATNTPPRTRGTPSATHSTPGTATKPPRFLNIGERGRRTGIALPAELHPDENGLLDFNRFVEVFDDTPKTPTPVIDTPNDVSNTEKDDADDVQDTTTEGATIAELAARAGIESAPSLLDDARALLLGSRSGSPDNNQHDTEKWGIESEKTVVGNTIDGRKRRRSSGFTEVFRRSADVDGNDDDDDQDSVSNDDDDGLPNETHLSQPILAQTLLSSKHLHEDDAPLAIEVAETEAASVAVEPATPGRRSLRKTMSPRSSRKEMTPRSRKGRRLSTLSRSAVDVTDDLIANDALDNNAIPNGVADNEAIVQDEVVQDTVVEDVVVDNIAIDNVVDKDIAADNVAIHDTTANDEVSQNKENSTIEPISPSKDSIDDMHKTASYDDVEENHAASRSASRSLSKHNTPAKSSKYVKSHVSDEVEKNHTEVENHEENMGTEEIQEPMSVADDFAPMDFDHPDDNRSMDEPANMDSSNDLIGNYDKPDADYGGYDSTNDEIQTEHGNITDVEMREMPELAEVVSRNASREKGVREVEWLKATLPREVDLIEIPENKQNTVAPDETATRRSSRLRMKPVDFWREKIARKLDNEGRVIITMENIGTSPPAKRSQPKRKVKKMRVPKRVAVVNYETGEETERCVFVSPDMLKIEESVPQGEYRFQKLFAEGNFASGSIVLPPGSSKPMRNSNRSTISFVVLKGRVEVEINGTTAQVGQGAFFFVPRGNHYSLHNLSSGISSLFFNMAS